MPTYKVTDPQTGKTLRLTGDSPPTEQELNDVFSQFKDAPADTPRTAQDSGEALLTNLPTKGFGQDLVRGLPATAGGMVGGIAGAAAGLPFGPAGVIAGGILGAGLGGASGEAVRQATAQGTAAAFPEQNYPILRPGQVMGQVGIQGATQAAGQAIGSGVGAAAKALRPGVNKLGAQVMRVGAGIPEKAGEAAMRNPSILLDAPSKETASGAYKAFEGYTGLKGLDDLAGARAKPWSASELYETALQTANKIKQGLEVGAQELYTASQAENALSRLAKYGNPDAAAMLGSGSLKEAGKLADDALGAALPEYQTLRTGYAAAKTADQFSSWLPLNKNTSPNVLRGVTAATTAGAGVMAGQPAALAALPLVSPKFYGTGLKAAALAGKIPAGVYRVGAQGAAGATGSALEQAYLNSRAVGSQPDPNWSAIGGRRPVYP